MNLARRKIGMLSAGWLAGLLIGLSAGCSTPTASQKVYDRYAELVASRNQPARSAPATTAKPADKPAAPAAAAKTVAPAPAKAPVAPPASPAAVKPIPTSPAPPVQVIAPKPADKVGDKPVAVAPAHPVAPQAVVSTPPAPSAAPVAVAPPPAAVPAPVAPPAPAAMAPAPVAAPVSLAAASAPAVAAPAAAPAGLASEGGYLLKVGDGLQVYLRGIPTPEVIEDVIDEAGMITLPFINEVQAAGLMASDLERTIRQTYLDQDIYRNITVNVVVPTRSYFIQGEIRAPGRYQIMSATRVSQAIAGAGGYTEFASGKVQIKRGGQIIKVIRNARRLERAPEDDILLEPDDVVEVLRSWI